MTRRKNMPIGRFSVVLVTCPTDSSEKIARAVMKSRAAACVNIVPGVHSIYRWKGKVEDSNESLLLIKTTAAKLGKLERVIKGVHPYEVPEIVALSATKGYRPYLEWIAESVGTPLSSARRSP